VARCKPRRASRRRFITALGSLLSLTASPFKANSRPALLRLREVVRVPLTLVAEDWQQQRFEAWVSREEIRLSGASQQKPFDRLFFGVLSRLPASGESSSVGVNEYLAYCTFCPHEACEVKLVDDSSLLKLEKEVKVGPPLLVCPCHFSVFDPREQGALLSGPAPRGLYRFEFHRDKDHIVITHIESAALALFQV
jgi:Rieske Fe-S protein